MTKQVQITQAAIFTNTLVWTVDTLLQFYVIREYCIILIRSAKQGLW